MKKFISLVAVVALCAATSLSLGFSAGCAKDENVISVCASDVPHAEVLSDVVKSELEKKGYALKVTVLDWTMQNDGVAGGDYDANYFQHVPYLETYAGSVKLFATCKVHYEPLGIYYGKAAAGSSLLSGKTFAVCNDASNAVRAFKLLCQKGVIDKSKEGENFPISENEETLSLGALSDSWTSSDGNVSVKLVAENLLVQAMSDYDFVLLPCNTAYTGKVGSDKRIAVEDDPEQVSSKANVIAARENDYKNNADYKAKIDALTDVMLSEAVSNYFATKYLGAMTCDASTQIDLRK